VFVDAHHFVFVSASYDGGNRLVLDGEMIVSDDILVSLRGVATMRASGDTRRVDCALELASEVGGTRAPRFTMVRPASGTPAASGTYAVEFGRSPDGLASESRATLELVVTPDGRGVFPPTVETDPLGGTRGAIGAGECSLSSQGRIWCSTSYAAVDPRSPAAACDDGSGPRCWMILQGTIAFDSGDAGGDFDLFAPFQFPPLTMGGWAATRLP
jgi:hypothetical protein